MIYIPKGLPKKHSAVYIYTVISANYDPIVTTQNLLNRMNISNTQKHREFINTALHTLSEQGYIICIKLKQNKYEIHSKPIDGGYYSVDYSKIDKIMHIEDKCNRLSLVDYYLVLMDTINYYTHIGFTSIETLSKRAGISTYSAVSYNKILVNNHLILKEKGIYIDIKKD